LVKNQKVNLHEKSPIHLFLPSLFSHPAHPLFAKRRNLIGHLHPLDVIGHFSKHMYTPDHVEIVKGFPDFHRFGSHLLFIACLLVGNISVEAP
jgi:hypothetical protein